MQRDDEPTILASIAAASARLRKAEDTKKTADSAARQAKADRDRERRVLADRVIAATQNAVPQNLIAAEAGRSREWVRLTNQCAVYPDSVTAEIYSSRDGSFRDWRVAAEMAWSDAARKEGLEPLLVDSFEPEGNQVAQVLVYDQPWTLLLDGDTVRVASGSKHYPDPAFDPEYSHEKKES
ncbi:MULTISPECIES: hypothetical protein [unclassified Streptomyces]|uniref:hypothetical protein n=1 Tax=unclassified Streptomyces TaxID=2593676 RepID=UPI00136E0694|nr:MULTISPECIES: hypothetical protein [unclassified Streptomyces]NDZ98465.1 hypothetical protein [Streptomyces sp. SID10116]MYY79808.1 hypothetical protein [Streptomyces sp. SID335]MYZ16024.1 hypothetical protein [Streptomyces sp. SID337]NDZ84455.1 hypothetical protein [Streptomyces sp. SID10115]NEB43418.1 hypothetical protein [Streptomyces sp. SID339]